MTAVAQEFRRGRGNDGGGAGMTGGGGGRPAAAAWDSADYLVDE